MMLSEIKRIGVISVAKFSEINIEVCQGIPCQRASLDVLVFLGGGRSKSAGSPFPFPPKTRLE